jgi:protein-disulfide isomerase-like protein with CxxC motif
MTQEKVSLNLNRLNTYLLIILLVLVLYSSYTVFVTQKQLAGIKPKEPPKPAQLQLTVIPAIDCKDCLAPEAFLTALQQLPLTNFTETILEKDSTETKELIEKYGITRLPAAVVTGEIEKTTIPAFEKQEDAYVFSQSPPPYYDLEKQKIMGLVEITFVTDNACTECFDITQFGSQLKQTGLSIKSEKTIDYNSAEGKELLDKYKITSVPALILSEDAIGYDVVKEAWATLGTQETDGMLVLRTPTPPYKDLETQQVKGILTLTYVVDSSCTECYNASQHKLLLEQSFGTKIGSEKTIDITTTEGKMLAENYGITLVPTFLIDQEAEAYPGLVQAWQEVGTKANDGTFVFTAVNLLQGVTYKNLSNNKIINATG